MHRGLHPSSAVHDTQKSGVTFNTCDSPNISRKDTAEAFPLDPEELGQLVWEMPAGRIAAAYGIPEKSIEKRCRALGIKLPPRGYWLKIERVNEKEEEEA